METEDDKRNSRGEYYTDWEVTEQTAELMRQYLHNAGRIVFSDGKRTFYRVGESFIRNRKTFGMDSEGSILIANGSADGLMRVTGSALSRKVYSGLRELKQSGARV